MQTNANKCKQTIKQIEQMQSNVNRQTIKYTQTKTNINERKTTKMRPHVGTLGLNTVTTRKKQ